MPIVSVSRSTPGSLTRSLARSSGRWLWLARLAPEQRGCNASETCNDFRDALPNRKPQVEQARMLDAGVAILRADTTRREAAATTLRARTALHTRVRTRGR